MLKINLIGEAYKPLFFDAFLVDNSPLTDRLYPTTQTDKILAEIFPEEGERFKLWNMMGRILSGIPQLAIFRGGPGCGKSTIEYLISVISPCEWCGSCFFPSRWNSKRYEGWWRGRCAVVDKWADRPRSEWERFWHSVRRFMDHTDPNVIIDVKQYAMDEDNFFMWEDMFGDNKHVFHFDTDFYDSKHESIRMDGSTIKELFQIERKGILTKALYQLSLINPNRIAFNSFQPPQAPILPATNTP